MTDQSEPFFPGDKVAHVETGKEMTVFETNDSGVRCFWEEAGERKEDYFSADKLRMVEEAQ